MRNITGKIRLIVIALGVAMCLGISGCADQQASEVLRRSEVPGDFAIEFDVRGKPAGDDFTLRTSRYLVEPNRRLSAAMGHGAIDRTYPAFSRELSHAQIAQLYRFVEQHHLLTHDTAAAKPATADEPVYHLNITAMGQRYRLSTTPTQSPGSLELLRQLIALTGYTYNNPRGESSEPYIPAPFLDKLEP